jgi:hypothetical protein
MIHVSYRFMSPGIVSNSMESLFPLKGFSSIAPTPNKSRESNDSIQKVNCCSQCMSSYEQELALMEQEKKAHMLSTTPPQSKSIDQGQQALPQWLQIAKSANGAKGPDMVQVSIFLVFYYVDCYSILWQKIIQVSFQVACIYSHLLRRRIIYACCFFPFLFLVCFGQPIKRRYQKKSY